jgi:hypothetical protein
MMQNNNENVQGSLKVLNQMLNKSNCINPNLIEKKINKIKSKYPHISEINDYNKSINYSQNENVNPQENSPIISNIRKISEGIKDKSINNADILNFAVVKSATKKRNPNKSFNLSPLSALTLESPSIIKSINNNIINNRNSKTNELLKKQLFQHNARDDEVDDDVSSVISPLKDNIFIALRNIEYEKEEESIQEFDNSMNESMDFMTESNVSYEESDNEEEADIEEDSTLVKVNKDELKIKLKTKMQSALEFQLLEIINKGKFENVSYNLLYLLYIYLFIIIYY